MNDVSEGVVRRFVQGGEKIEVRRYDKEKYYIVYSVDLAPCYCGAFRTLEAALKTLNAHRPLAEEVKDDK